MSKPIYGAMSGAMARLNQLDNAANNLANVNTVGFRANRSVFEQELVKVPERMQGQIRASMPPTTVPLDTVHVNTRNTVDTRQTGALQATGESLDVAIAGEGFFVIDGEPKRLTRDGRFHVDASNRLVNRGEQAVLGLVRGATGPIHIDPGASVTIDSEGNVVTAGKVVAKILVAQVNEPGALTALGDGLYLPQPGDEPQAMTDARLAVASLEQSNVDPTRALVELIAAQRGFELSHRVLQTASEMDRKAANELGQLK